MDTLQDVEADKNSYITSCFTCANRFDAMLSRWCTCTGNLRTLVCPDCHTCFCASPLPFKHQFWGGAPRALREDVRRFGSAFPVQPDAWEPPGSHVASPSEAAPVILIVDDDEAIGSLVACVVAQLGYTTMLADDPHRGLRMARAPEVKVVITDALMPGMDGRELCRRLKETGEGAAKKVIVMTSLYTSRRYRSEAFNVFKADEYLSKPVDFRALANVLERFAPLP